jgi:hypothetical protein
MAKKLNFKIDYFEDYAMLSLVSQLKDYRLAYFINETLDLDLVKYDDFSSESGSDAFPWFFYNEGENGASFYLIGNRNREGQQMILQKGIDYFLLTRELFDEERLQQMIISLRQTEGIQGVFLVNMNTIKNLDLMIENLELHELEKVTRLQKEGPGMSAR